MQWKHFHRNKICKNILLVLLFVGGIVAAYFVTMQLKQQETIVVDNSYRVYYWFERKDWEDGNISYLPIPRVEGLADETLQTTINENLKEVFFAWLPRYFGYTDLRKLYMHMNTDRFLCLETTYSQASRRITNTVIYNTIDMQTGEILYLDDLIEVDEELVNMILTEGIAMAELDFMTGECDVPFSQESLDRRDPALILEYLQECSVPYDEENWSYKPTFCIEKDRLYLESIFVRDDRFYIELEDIEDKLKVPKW